MSFKVSLVALCPPLARDNSTYKLQRTSFLKFGSHYNLPFVEKKEIMDYKNRILYA
jgi:hypothetical protein